MKNKNFYLTKLRGQKMSEFSKSTSVFLTFLLLAVCAAADSPNEPAKETAPAISRWLVSPELLKDSYLKVLWQTELPLVPAENIQRLTIIGGNIYALSTRNYIVCLNGQTGAVIFSRPLTQPGLPVVGLDLYKNELLTIAGNELLQINTLTGVEIGKQRLDFGVTCPAARNASYFYIPAVNNRLRAFRAQDKVLAFEAVASNVSKITSVITNENDVIFATDAGNIISITPNSPQKLWQFDAQDGIVKPIIKDANSLFAASKDTNVYKLDILTGNLIWKYQADAILEKGPRVTSETVYQYARGKGVTAIDKNTGQKLWELNKAVDFLAESKGISYLITGSGELIAMDNKKAKKLYSVKFEGPLKTAANTANSKIYIADNLGRIACLVPIE
jgi:outer membrane protein assembly factor BamB